jgi:hypothetical protein
LIFSVWPPRLTVSVIVCPGVYPSIALMKPFVELTAAPLIAVITSPGLRPAAAAGEPDAIGEEHAWLAELAICAPRPCEGCRQTPTYACLIG